MPIYEFSCPKCNHEFEKLLKISEITDVACPNCDQDKVLRKISAAGFRLKGSGWYESDYKKKSNAPAANDSVQGSSAAEKNKDSNASKSAAATSKNTTDSKEKSKD